MTWNGFPACPAFEAQAKKSCTNCAKRCPADNFKACRNWTPAFGCWYDAKKIKPPKRTRMIVVDDTYTYAVLSFITDADLYWMPAPPLPEEMPE